MANTAQVDVRPRMPHYARSGTRRDSGQSNARQLSKPSLALLGGGAVNLPIDQALDDQEYTLNTGNYQR